MFIQTQTYNYHTISIHSIVTLNMNELELEFNSKLAQILFKSPFDILRYHPLGASLMTDNGMKTVVSIARKLRNMKEQERNNPYLVPILLKQDILQIKFL